MLKEQYAVTAHVPNFDFRTGCREIKRCEESKRSLKNPFASHLADFNTTLKLLGLTGQWYIAPVKFLPASVQAQVILKGIRRNETARIKTVRKKPLRHRCDWGDLVKLSILKQNVLQRSVSKLLNEPPYSQQNQTNRSYAFRKTSAMKSEYNFFTNLCDDS